MNTKSLLILILLLSIILAFMFGCGKDSEYSRMSSPSNLAEKNSQLVYNKSCMMVLIHHEGVDEIDKRIIEHQNIARTSNDSIPYLEHLGWAYISKARISFDAGFYTFADQTALCIQAIDPNSLEALLLRGHVLHSIHEFKKAENVARQLVALRGRWFDYGLLGDVLMEQGKLDDAVLAYEAMMDQKPGPQAYSRAAHIRWLKGDLPGAMELMRMAAGSHNSANAEATAWAYTRLAVYQLQAANYVGARFNTAAALSLQKNYAPALFVQGRILLAQNKSSEAINVIRRAVELSPLPEYQWMLIDAICKYEQCENASHIENELLKHGVINDARTHALYLSSTGHNTKLALHLSERELEVRKDIHTLDTLAWALMAEGQIEKAYKFSQQALAEGTKDARIFYHAGSIALMAGYLTDAQQWLKQAAELKHMLLPSEQEHLFKEFVTLSSQINILAKN